VTDGTLEDGLGRIRRLLLRRPSATALHRVQEHVVIRAGVEVVGLDGSDARVAVVGNATVAAAAHRGRTGRALLGGGDAELQIIRVRCVLVVGEAGRRRGAAQDCPVATSMDVVVVVAAEVLAHGLDALGAGADTEALAVGGGNEAGALLLPLGPIQNSEGAGGTLDGNRGLGLLTLRPLLLEGGKEGRGVVSRMGRSRRLCHLDCSCSEAHFHRILQDPLGKVLVVDAAGIAAAHGAAVNVGLGGHHIDSGRE